MVGKRRHVGAGSFEQDLDFTEAYGDELEGHEGVNVPLYLQALTKMS